MFQRQVDEHPFDRQQLAVPTPVKRGDGDRARPRVGSKGSGSATVDVARQLVGEEDQCERALGRLRPVVQRAGTCSFHQWREAFGEFGIGLS